MFKQFVIFTLLILVRTAAAQSVYVSNQQTPVQFGKAAPDNCRFDLLNDRTGAAATLSGLALAFHPNGRLFGVFGNVLAEIDTTNGDCSAFQSATVRRFPLSGNTDFSKYNALTCDSVGIFYAVNKLGELAYFDSRTNQTAIIGVVRAANLIGDTGAGGDLIFYKNDLYLAASGRRLIKVNIQNPALSTLHMTMDCGSCFDEMASLVGFVRCNGKNVYALTTGFAPGAIRSLVYRIDIERRTTTFVCGLPIQINDAASRYEFLPLPPDTTRVLQSTCNILIDNKTDT